MKFLTLLVGVCVFCFGGLDVSAQAPQPVKAAAKRAGKEQRPSLGSVLQRVAPKAGAPHAAAPLQPATIKPRGPVVRSAAPAPRRAAPPKPGTWPLAMTLEKPSALPAFVFKGFLNVGAEVNSTPRFSFFMEEAEMELQVHFSPMMRMELAVQLTKDVLTLTGNPPAITLLDQLLQKALLFFQLPKGFAIWLGRTFSYQGWEAVNTLDRTTVSIGYTFTTTPSTLTGMALRWAGGSSTVETQFDLFLANRWDSNNNEIAQPSVGLFASLTLKLAPQFSVVVTATPSYGVEPAAIDSLSAITPVVSFNTNMTLNFFNSRWQIVVDMMMASEPTSGKAWYALMVLTHAMATDFLGFTLRYSRLHDFGKLLSVAGAENQEWALAALFLPLQATSGPAWTKPLRGLRVLLEGRIDMAGNDSSTIAGRVLLSVILPFQVTIQPSPARK